VSLFVSKILSQLIHPLVVGGVLVAIGGVQAVPAATDYRVVDHPVSPLDLVPSAGALAGSTAAIREYVGYLVYDWRGWIDGTAADRSPAPTARAAPRSGTGT